MRAEKRVRVQANRFGPDRADRPWHVICEHCAGESLWFFGVALKGWAPTWESAQRYADAHARAHEARRCPTCLHVPTGQLPEEVDQR